MRLALVLVLSASVAGAETYRFQGGATALDHDHRCGKRLDNWMAASTLTIDHGVGTLTFDGSDGRSAYSAIAVTGAYLLFYVKDTHDVVIRLDPLDCDDAHCTALYATYSVIRHAPGEARDWFGRDYCYEQWAGRAIPIARVGQAPVPGRSAEHGAPASRSGDRP
jgi:hypothetical protein